MRLQDAGLHKLTPEDRANLLDVLEGRAEPKSDAVRGVFREVRSLTDEIAGEAETAKVQVREKRTIKPGEKFPEGFKPTRGQQERHEAGRAVAISYRRPFRRRENFFPHVIPDVESLRSGAIRRDVIQNIVRQGIRPNETSAAEFLDSYRAFIDKGGRQKALEQYLIESGQAKGSAEAYRLLTQFRKRAIKRQGSLEYSRQVDLPFYDPDPARVLPKFVTASSLRLSQIREFGQDNQRINRLIKKIADAGGNDALVRSWVDRITGIVQEPNTGAAQLSRLVRVAQGFKLGLASIPNATQGALNTLLRSRDLGTVLAGGKGLLSAEGRRFAKRSGASLESVINEMLRHAGAEHSSLGTFLKATGFSATEQANRIWAANSGLHWANLNLRRLKLNPRNAKARHALEELGLKPDALLKLGKLDGDAALMAAKKFSDLTQFRSRPQDMPAFASTTWGKVFWQFKNYPYNQMRLVYDGLVGELRRGNPGEAAKTFLLLATVFPLTGEAIADVRSFITGRKRTTKGLERYFENIAQAGSLGMVYELLESAKYGKALEFIVGPTVSEAGQIIDTARRENRARNLTKMAFRRIPGIGPVLVNRLFPPRRSGGRKSAARDVGGRY